MKRQRKLDLLYRAPKRPSMRQIVRERLTDFRLRQAARDERRARRRRRTPATAAEQLELL